MRRIGPIAAVLGIVGTPLLAQDECAAKGYSGTPRQVCQTAVDGIRVFHPWMGVLVSGGNPVIGTAATRGGLPHLALTARVNAVKISLPDPTRATTTPVPSIFDGVAPAPVVEAALGLFPGLGGGLLSVDALGSASLLPTNQIDKLSVDSNAASIGDVALGLGYGARVGIVKGSLLIPSVSVSVMRRHIPRLQYGSVTAGDQFAFATDLDATNIRATASVRLLLLDVAAGLGWDKYTSKALVVFSDPTRVPNRQQISLDLDNSRTLLFADAGLNLALVQLVGEIGYLTGKDQQLTTSFRDFDPKSGSVFWAVGLRVSL